jgi:4-diphosphocytidyl-2-C-methyl-D-erythritol kinase
LARAAGRPPQARITLHKSLPIAAGIGGGSADAAATLLALRALWKLPIDDDALATLAAPLGADIPVCLRTVPSIITGIGHDVGEVGILPSFAVLLVNPAQPLSTAAVFKNMHRPFSDNQPMHEFPSQRDDFIQALARQRNDLEVPARALCPVLDEVLAALSALPQCRLARMSGSGATCFGLFDVLAEAEAAAALLSGNHQDWWVRAASIEGAG